MSFVGALVVIESMQSKRLIRDCYYLEGSVCAIGALFGSMDDMRRLQFVANRERYSNCIQTLWCKYPWVSEKLRCIGLCRDEAKKLQDHNDFSVFNETEEGRYQRVLTWLRERVVDEKLRRLR